MASVNTFLLFLVTCVRTGDPRTLSGTDIEKLNATLDAAKAKFSAAEYSYLDDPSPGDYFDSIVTAVKIVKSVMEESREQKTYDGMHAVISARDNFFEAASVKTEDQASPFGTRECKLLPEEFRNCRIVQRISDILNVAGVVSPMCFMFDIDSVLKVATTLMGEQCEQGLAKNGTMEHNMQRRMMQYSEANGFEGGSENNCLLFFVAHFTQSSQAVRIFKTAVDKYLLAVLNNSVPWACDDVDAEAASLNVTRTGDIIDEAKRKVSSGDYFFNDSSPAEYFDSIKTAAGYLAVTLKERTTSQVVEKRKVIEEAFMSFFGELSSTTDEQAEPFGINECWLLPGSLRDITVVPLVSTSLDAMQETFGDYEGMAEACEKSNVDDSLKTLEALVGTGCEEGDAQNGTTEADIQQGMMRYAEELGLRGVTQNNCMHLFVARYTNSEEAVQMFKKAFDKYLLATIAVQAVCAVFTPRCNEEAYRKNVLDTHASFAASLARINSIQLNGTITRKCDDSQEEIISKMNASCERVKTTVASDTNLLEEMTAEEFENTTFGMAHALTMLHAEVVSLSDDAKADKVFPIYKTLAYYKDRLNWSRDVFDDYDYNYLSCYALHPTNPEDVLNEIKEFVAPGCQNGSIDDFHVAMKWRKDVFEYATTHGFDGCEDNKCLQVFVARYTNHSKDALGKLQHSMSKYVYLSVFLKSFCDSLTLKSIRNERRNKTIRQLQSLKTGVALTKNLPSQAETGKPCARNETDPLWAEQVNSYAKDVIKNETDRLQPKSWEDRQGLHKAVAKGIVERLRRDKSMKKYVFEALAYLPYVRHERHGFITFPRNSDVVRNESMSVNYVASRRASSILGRNVTGSWTGIENNAKRILEFIFSYRSETNLTRRLEQASNRFGPFLTEAGFSTMVALRCGYEFVWYELGYRYFPAGYATSNHTLFTQGGNKYDDKCGQIVFFL